MSATLSFASWQDLCYDHAAIALSITLPCTEAVSQQQLCKLLGYLEKLAQKPGLKTPLRVPLQGCLKSCCEDGLFAQIHDSQTPAGVARQ